METRRRQQQFGEGLFWFQLQRSSELVNAAPRNLSQQSLFSIEELHPKLSPNLSTVLFVECPWQISSEAKPLLHSSVSNIYFGKQATFTWECVCVLKVMTCQIKRQLLSPLKLVVLNLTPLQSLDIIYIGLCSGASYYYCKMSQKSCYCSSHGMWKCHH